MRNQRIKILVIDDDGEFLEVAHGLLSEGAYEVITCADPRQAMKLIEYYSPDRIILDLVMAEIDGRQLLPLFRKNYPQIPVLICTGMPNVDPARLISAGAAIVFQKPFSPHALFDALDQVA